MTVAGESKSQRPGATGISIGDELRHTVWMRWQFPIDMTDPEQTLCRKLGVRSRFFCFLRRVRHLLFDEQFQELLASMYEQRPSGNRPVPPALLAMTILLQAYTKASDAEAIECMKADRRWQMVLDCLDVEPAPFCQKTLAFFRLRLVEMSMDEELLARTVQLASESKLFDPKKLGKLRVAIDSAPLEGAGRVEDTINLIGHATRDVVKLVATQRGASSDEIARAIGLTIITTNSVKACLDIDWNDRDAQTQALRKLISEAEALQVWIDRQAPGLLRDKEIRAAVQTLQRVIAQDTEPDPNGSGPCIKQGVAPDRQISLSDPDMRHGRKSSSQRIDGYKRYEAIDLDSGMAVAACVLPAVDASAVNSQRAASGVGGLARLAVQVREVPAAVDASAVNSQRAGSGVGGLARLSGAGAGGAGSRHAPAPTD